ncbi:MAG: phosphoribosyl-AMP cyclohydrolase [Pseudomonadota bacterium]
MANDNSFPSPDTLDALTLEEGTVFSPRFDADGLIVTVVLDAETHKLLMVAYMNRDALRETLTTGIAHYWSRSRAKLWRKGEESGNTQELVEMRTDCDQDVIELRVKQHGAGVACHTGRYSCFYRVVESSDGGWRLAKDEHMTPQFDPRETYKKSS